MTISKPLHPAALLAVCAAVALTLTGCDKPASITLTAAPPGPADLGPATGLSTPPAGAVVFDLSYRPQTGSAEDICYNSFYGYGEDMAETKTNAFLADVRKRSSSLQYVCSDTFKGRKWGAVEYHGRQASAFYFDLNANGKLDEKETILPTRKLGQGVEFITPDFVQPQENGGQTLCRVLLQANFYEGEDQPNCMWSAAAVLEGTATLEGQPARLLLFASEPGGSFDQYGSSDYSLLLGKQTRPKPDEYVSREALSSLITCEGKFYRLKVEGRRSNGLPARVLLTKDTSPTGTLALKLTGSNSLQSTVTSLSLRGTEDKAVYFRAFPTKSQATLPVGSYTLDSGVATYGAGNAQDWEVSFSKGPCVTIKAGQVTEQSLGQPALTVRAVKENERWATKPTELASCKQGTRIYLEPRVVGAGGETLRRFCQPTAGRGRKADRPPHITITGPDGKELLSKTMEYG